MLNQSECNRFCRSRRDFISREFSHLNPEQREGVLATQGPLLLLAGAGSGKTTVLIHRIANLIKYGCGSDSDEVPDWVTEDDLNFLESFNQNPPDDKISPLAEQLCRLHPVAPWNICAITFTNKAAREIKSRLEQELGTSATDVWAGTFHSICVRILRRDIDRLGFSNQFTIYDTEDSQRVIKEVMKSLNLDEKVLPPRSVLHTISKAKDILQMAEEYETEVRKTGDFRLIQIAQIYREYEQHLREADALDFDDIILHTVRLLQMFDEVRDFWQCKFQYVLVDEYQDTNHIQYLLSSLLAGKHQNLCVVGDDDQSIYRFRGATIENILSFEEQYQNARVIRLEQNYRSTQNILDAANAVIQNNQGRKGKHLWTAKQAGERIRFYTAMNESDEAQYVASSIIAGVHRGDTWSDYAILYRMNAQSNQLEYAFKRNGIPYTVYGGTKFFDRAEIKDMLAYLCVIHNPEDDLRLRRIINTPARGIGARTVETAEMIAKRTGQSLYDVILHAGDYPDLARQSPKLFKFTDLIFSLQKKLSDMELPSFYDEVITETGYITALESKNAIENRSKIENVQELRSSIQGYLENAESPTLAGFLDEVSLYSDLDDRDPNAPCVTMMTIHSAKGLEFQKVFIVGMEEGIFPGIRAIGETDEMEEERRLCYVAITRAKSCLYMTCAEQRMIFGHTNANRPSRFIREIPDSFLEKSGCREYDLDTQEYGGRWQDEFYRENDRTQNQFIEEKSVRHESQSTVVGEGHWGNSSKNYDAAISSSLSSRHSTPIAIDIQKGELVQHDAFGMGMVISITRMGGDALVEIAFDNVGTKRLMYKSAAPHLRKGK